MTDQQLIMLQQRTDELSNKLALLASLANQVNESFTNLVVQDEEEQDTLVVSVDSDGDFRCTLYQESITLLIPEDVLRVARWLGVPIVCRSEVVAAELRLLARDSKDSSINALSIHTATQITDNR
jgi:bifunctional DNase/RNase